SRHGPERADARSWRPGRAAVGRHGRVTPGAGGGSVGGLVGLTNVHRDAPARAQLVTVLHGPFPNGTRLLATVPSGRRGTAAIAACLARNRHVRCHRLPECLGIPARQVNLVLAAVQAEADRLVTLGAVQVVLERDVETLCHRETLLRIHAPTNERAHSR